MNSRIAFALLCLVAMHQCASLASAISASASKQIHASDAAADKECLERMNVHYYGHSFVYPPGYIETYLKVLVYVARADGEFSEDEKNALTAQLVQSLYPSEKILKVFDMDVSNVDPKALFASLPGGFEDNTKMLVSDAAVVAAADGLSDAERETLKNLGQALHLSDEVFTGIVRGIVVMTEGRLIYRSYF